MKLNGPLASMLAMGLMDSINLSDSFRNDDANDYRPTRKAPRFGSYVPPEYYTSPPKLSKRAKRRKKAKA